VSITFHIVVRRVCWAGGGLSLQLYIE